MVALSPLAGLSAAFTAAHNNHHQPMAYLPRFDLSEPQATALLAALDQLTPEQVHGLLPETQQNLAAAYQRVRSELTRCLYCSR